MQVPPNVRAAALAAFDTRRPGESLLPLLDEAEDAAPQEGPRQLRYAADDVELRVEVLPAAGGLVTLVADVLPRSEVQVALEYPEPSLRLSVRGTPPVRLTASARGMTRVALVTELDTPAERRWVTTWTSL